MLIAPEERHLCRSESKENVPKLLAELLKTSDILTYKDVAPNGAFKDF